MVGFCNLQGKLDKVQKTKDKSTRSLEFKLNVLFLGCLPVMITTVELPFIDLSLTAMDINSQNKE